MLEVAHGPQHTCTNILFPIGLEDDNILKIKTQWQVRNA